jgi:hypothetical protein
MLPGCDLIVTPGVDFDNSTSSSFVDFNSGHNCHAGSLRPSLCTWFVHELGHSLGLGRGDHGDPVPRRELG